MNWLTSIFIALFVFGATTMAAGAKLYAKRAKWQTEERELDAAFLKAIREVEGAEDGRRGRLGERGPWQMMPDVWASYIGTAEMRAQQHLAKLKQQLERRGVAPLPYNLALCWNAGFERTVSGRAPDQSYDYARRVCALIDQSKLR